MTMPRAQHTATQTLHDLDHIPTFATEAEEAAFWDEHELGDEVLERMGPLPADILPPARPRTASIDLHLDAGTLQRLRALAARRHVGFRVLIQRFVTDRLAEEEQRESSAEVQHGRNQ
jgi:hypothetical protein